jgi:shikimate kinase
LRAILIGMKHSGKSTLGRMLAGRAGVPFYDTDRVMEARFAARGGIDRPVREIFRKLGAEGFSHFEVETVRELASRLGGDHVLALGGRTALNPQLHELLRGLGTIVFLEVDPEHLWARVSGGGIPSFLDPRSPREDFLRLYGEREPRYREMADLVVRLCGTADPEENLDRLEAALQEVGDGR